MTPCQARHGQEVPEDAVSPCELQVLEETFVSVFMDNVVEKIDKLSVCHASATCCLSAKNNSCYCDNLRTDQGIFVIPSLCTYDHVKIR